MIYSNNRIQYSQENGQFLIILNSRDESDTKITHCMITFIVAKLINAIGSKEEMVTIERVKKLVL